jgi:hypothetical protein
LILLDGRSHIVREIEKIENHCHESFKIECGFERIKTVVQSELMVKELGL